MCQIYIDVTRAYLPPRISCAEADESSALLFAAVLRALPKDPSKFDIRRLSAPMMNYSIKNYYVPGGSISLVGGTQQVKGRNDYSFTTANINQGNQLLRIPSQCQEQVIICVSYQWIETFSHRSASQSLEVIKVMSS